MADTKISALTDGTSASSTDRIPVAISPFGAGTNRYVTPAYLDTFMASTTKTLTNKTISGASNTLSNIGNSSLTNSAITVGSTSISLGATSTTLAGLTSLAFSTDTILTRDAANTLALVNGTNAQKLNIYGTYSGSGANYERIEVGYNSSLGIYGVFTNQAGTGNANSLYMGTIGSNSLSFFTNSTTRWFINSSGTFLTQVDNTYDIGANGANRPRAIYTAGSMLSGADVRVAGTGSFYWNGRSQIQSPVDGVVKGVKADNTSAISMMLGQQTVATLPSAVTYPGALAFVTDANSTTARTTVAGGGSNKVLCMSDGTNWLIVA